MSTRLIPKPPPTLNSSTKGNKLCTNDEAIVEQVVIRAPTTAVLRRPNLSESAPAKALERK